MRVECSFVKDVLKGDNNTEIRLKLLEIIADELPPGEE